MTGSMRPGLPAVVLLLAAWVSVVLLAWPDRLAELTNPWIATFVAFGIAGAFIVLRRPRHPIGWLMLGFGLVASIGLMGFLMASSWLDMGALLEAAWADAIGNALMTVAVLTVPAVLVLFPDGFSPGRRGRPLLGFIAATALLGGVAALVNGGWGGDPEQALIASPLRLRMAPVGGLLSSIFFAGLGLSMTGAGVSVLLRWRAARGLERQQMKWLAVAASLVVIAMAVVRFNTQDQWEIAVASAAFSSIPVAIGFAVLRYRLYEIDRIISRTLSYAVVVGMLGLVVLVLIAGLAIFLPSDDPLVVAVATLTVFALFNPLRRRVQRLVDRRFNRSRYDAEQVIDDFSGSLRERVDPENLVTDWVEVVEDTMQPISVGVWVRHE